MCATCVISFKSSKCLMITESVMSVETQVEVDKWMIVLWKLERLKYLMI